MVKAYSKKSLTGLSKEEEKLAGVSALGDLDGFRADLRKEFGAGTALDDDDNISGFIKTNIDALDYLLGGGLPQGKMTEVAGREGTGKSSFPAPRNTINREIGMTIKPRRTWFPIWS